MTIERANDLRAFRDFLDAKLSNGDGGLTPQECLDLWEVESESPHERAATVQAIREALDDMRAGDTGIAAREAIAEIRRKHSLPELP
jgi:hypothetical protein